MPRVRHDEMMLTLAPTRRSVSTEDQPMPMVSPRALTVAGLGSVTWAVAEVIPRCEKKLARDLKDAGFDYCLPLVARTTVSHRRRRTHHIPLIPQYVFAASNETPYSGQHIGNDLNAFLLDHDGVFGVIQVHTVTQVQFAGQLDTLCGAAMCGKVNDSVVAGTRCRVKYGPFEGKEGIIDALGKGWAIMPIEILGRKVTIEIPADDLEPLN